MKNIFNKNEITNYYFNVSFNITHHLLNYLNDNLENENYQTLCWDLKIALTINANEKNI